MELTQQDLDLEDLFTRDPVCEDDHLDDAGNPLPTCTITATGRFMWTRCSHPAELICEPLYIWATVGGTADCATCGPGCLRASLL